MHLVDTCGWIEWLTDGALAEKFGPYLSDSSRLIVPTLVQFELYKWCLRERNEAVALEVVGLTEACIVKPLDTRIALTAADLASRHKLAMADAVVYASSLLSGARLFTSDSHFSELPEVCFWQKN